MTDDPNLDETRALDDQVPEPEPEPEPDEEPARGGRPPRQATRKGAAAAVVGRGRSRAVALDPSLRIRDRVSTAFVIVTVLVFAGIFLNAMAFGKGGALTAPPTPRPTINASLLPSASPSSAPSLEPSATPAASEAASPATPSAAPAAS
jgi:hypothetical protein